MKYITTIDEKEYAIDIIDDHHVSINDKVYEVDFQSISGQPVYSMLIDGRSYEAYVSAGEEDEWQVLLLGRQYPIKVEDEREKRLKSAAGGKVQESGEFLLKAPMPGLVVAVAVNEGEQIEKGQVLVILESMKMQNELKSPRAGKVERIK
ncbi:MAG TPA: biotin/lipoyl-containing protein, partial [Anaerolineales bacterium]